MASVPPVQVVSLSHALSKLPYFDEFDAEALLTAFRDKWGTSKTTITAPELKELFLGLEYDKITVEEEEDDDDEDADAAVVEDSEALDTGEGVEEGEVEAKPPRKRKEEVSKHAEGTWDLLLSSGLVGRPVASGGDAALPVRDVLVTLSLAKGGYGEAAFRYAVKVVDPDATGALAEEPLWFCVTRTANVALDMTARNHLRKAWRESEKASVPEDGEEGGGEEEKTGEEEVEGSAPASADGADGAPQPARAPTPPREPKVLVDSWVERAAGDELLTWVLLRDIAIPPPPPGADEGLPPAEDD